MGWQHGYNTESLYTCGFYRELAPDWLDFAALLKGQPSPRADQSDPFHYLELGSGMGLGLCLLAAAYPEGRFVGIDFKPDHILHSRRLAAELQLRNIEFREGDFLKLAQDPGDLQGVHHYVVAHGIATWITETIQEALLALSATALLPGGLFYCSYNTTPGWLTAIPLQQLAWQLAASGIPAAEAVQQAASTLSELLGSEETPSTLALALPGLRERLAQIPKKDPSYLMQEYMNEGWQPLSVAVLHGRAEAHKLNFVASATLPDNFESLLPDNVRTRVLNETNSERRQMLIDLSVHQSFRRDVLVRGRLGLTTAEQAKSLGSLILRSKQAPVKETYEFSTSFGRVTGRADLYAACERALAEGPRSFADLHEQLQVDRSSLAQILALLLHDDRLVIDRGEKGEQAVAAAQQVNRCLRQLQRQGRPYSFQVAPRGGTAVSFGLVETLLLENPDPTELPEAAKAIGQQITGDAHAAAELFRARLAGLYALGVIQLPS